MSTSNMKHEFKSLLRSQNSINIHEANNPEKIKFSMTKFQGDNEEGINGYVDLIAMRESIDMALAFMKKNYRDFTLSTYAKYNMGAHNSEKPAKDLFEDDQYTAHMVVFARNENITNNFDSVKISHTSSFSRNKPREQSVDNLTIKINKWQGDDLEVGEQGFLRLIALKSAIENACFTLNSTFKGLHKQAEKEIGSRVKTDSDLPSLK